MNTGSKQQVTALEENIRIREWLGKRTGSESIILADHIKIMDDMLTDYHRLLNEKK